MRFKSVRKKYRCKRKFAWLPVRIKNQYVWLERYYVMQHWDRYFYERCGEGWNTIDKLTSEQLLCAKNDARYIAAYGKYINNVEED